MDWLNAHWSTISYIFWIVIPLLGLIGCVNAIFSLRDRYRNHRALKSKKAFEERVAQLKKELQKIIEYHEKPMLFFLDLISDGIIPAISFIGGFIMIVLAILSNDPNLKVNGYNPFLEFPLTFSIFLFFVPILYLFHILIKIKYLTHPNTFLKEIISLVRDGREKNLMSDKDLEEFTDLLEVHKKMLLSKANPFFIIDPEDAIALEGKKLEKIEK